MFPVFLGIGVFIRVLRNALKDPAFRGLGASVLLVLAVGTTSYPFLEGWSLLDSLYFSVVTLTTVGFGEFTPASTPGKMFTIIYILLGLGFMMSFVTTLVQRSQVWALDPNDGSAGDEAAALQDPASDADSLGSGGQR